MARQKEKNNNLPNDAAIQNGLSSIYQNQDGSLPDISHLEVTRKSRWLVYSTALASIVVLVGVSAWLGFLFFAPNSQISAQSIHLTIDGPQNVTSGEEVEYSIVYKNVEKTALRGVEVIAHFPQGFRYVNASPESATPGNNVWELGRLERGQEGKIVVRGTLIGDVGTIQSVTATASYQPENFNSTFKDTATFNSQITSSILELNFEGPDQTLPEKKITYTVTYKNTADHDLEKMQVIIDYPEYFVVQSAEPEPIAQSGVVYNAERRWDIPSIKRGESAQITLVGGFLPTDEQLEGSLVASIGFIDGETFTLQQEKTITTKIIGHGLSLNLIVNGSTQDQPIGLGETLFYSLVYKNLGQYELRNVTLSVTVDSQVVDFGGLEDKNGGALKEQTITWTPEDIAGLSVLRPLNEGKIDFTLPVLEPGKVSITDVKLETISLAKAIVGEVDDLGIVPVEVEGQPITHTINTDVEFIAQGRYFDDDNIAVGTGPLPPVVGKTTTLRIYWRIGNNAHALEDIKVVTTLPDGVSWVGKSLAQAGSISYQNGGRTVTWSIPKLATATKTDLITGWFDVAITPTKAQAKKIISLTDQSLFTATDTVSENVVSKVSGVITSNLEGDPAATGKGVVVDLSE